jgi:fibronectin type 3 domain-containing protein
MRLKKLCLFLFVFGAVVAVHAQSFVHPGALHTLADLDRMKTNVLAGNHPWIDDWNLLITDSQAQTNYGTHVQANMGASRQNADLDAHAAYLNAVRWYISGNANYANKATNILNSWAAAVNVVPSGTDIPGLIGIPIAHFAEAGELLRAYSGWKAADFQAYTNMMLTYLYPSCNGFLTNHNGACVSHYFANWDACNVEALIAMGVLCDNTNIYNQGVNYFIGGAGNGAISNAVPYLYSGGIGQEQESGRDQEHAQLGVGELAAACQTAWNQGLDLFSFSNNRLLASAEYLAQYTLGHEVPYTSLNDCSGDNMFFVSNSGRGRLDDRPIWELIYNHYAVLQGLNAPNTTRMVNLYRLEHGSADHFGYGTLTFTLNATNSPYPPIPLPAVPVGLTAQGGISQVTLNWAPAAEDLAQDYNVLRSTTSGGPYATIATWSANAFPGYTDTSVVNGTTYYYVVSADNQIGATGNSAEVSATPMASSSPPAAWTSQDVGVVTSAGNGVYASANDNTFIVTGNGTGIGGTADGGFQYAYVNATNDFTIVARLTVNNADQMGLMMRSSLATNAALVQIMMAANARESTYGVRTPGGNLNHYTSGDQFTVLPAWYKLVRSGNAFTAYQSADGVNWVNVQSSFFSMGATYYAGIAINSGNATFDNVAYTNAAVIGSFAPPAAPATLTGTAVASNQVCLTWSPVMNAAGYNVKRSTTSGGPYTNLATATPATGFCDASAVGNTTYYYVVSAINGGGESTNSIESSALTPPPSPSAPPTGLTAAATPSQVLLSWSASIGADTYNIKRSTTSGGPYTNIATGVIANFVDTNVSSGLTYFYVVSAVNSAGESSNSSQVSVPLPHKLTGTIIGTPGSWNNLGNTISNVFDGNLGTYFDGPDASGDWAGLDFGPGVSNVITQIQYCPRASFASRMVGGVFQGANEPAFSAPTTLFTVSATPAQGVMTVQAISNTNAFRYVRYYGPANGNCNVAEVEFDGLAAISAPPAAPASLSAVAGDGQVFLNWNAVVGATAYNIMRSTTNGGPYAFIGSSTGTNYTDSILSDGVTYYYVIIAINAVGQSADSTQVSAVPVSLIPPQISFSANGNQLQLSWPTDHVGWALQVQTNSLGTNWTTLFGSTATDLWVAPIDPMAGTVFYRLVYP